MNLHVFVLALLVFGAAGVHSRAIDDVDNSIESSEQQQQQRSQVEQDWIKFTKQPPAKLLQTLGSTVEISCEVMGSQIPTITWVVGNMPLSEIETVESNNLDESSASAIVRVRSTHIVDHMLSEPRTYTCVGHTGSKTVYASTTVYPQSDLKDLVQVRDKSYPGPHKPRIIYSEKLHLDLVGSNVELPCRVSARPKATVRWMNGEGNIIKENQRFKFTHSGALLITDIKWEDMGAYKCIAHNALGKDTADTFIYPVLKEEM